MCEMYTRHANAYSVLKANIECVRMLKQEIYRRLLVFGQTRDDILNKFISGSKPTNATEPKCFRHFFLTNAMLL